jgi:hypothetical protein
MTDVAIAVFAHLSNVADRQMDGPTGHINKRQCLTVLTATKREGLVVTHYNYNFTGGGVES